MFASSGSSLSLLLRAGATASFPSEAYRSPPPSSSSPWATAAGPTIHLERLAKTLSASQVLRGMAHSPVDDGSSDHDPVTSVPSSSAASAAASSTKGTAAEPRGTKLHLVRPHERPSPSAATASGIAAMSLSFIIHDDTENSPENQDHGGDDHRADYGVGNNSGGAPASIEDDGVRKPLGANVGSTGSSTSSGSSMGFGVHAILNTVCAKPDCYRTIRGPPGSFCKYHKQSRFCRAENCNKSAKTGGYCISHGGGKRCSFPECTKSAKQGGLCISHGGGKRCSESGCTKSALVGGFCSAHGGGRKCKTAECTKTALLGGFCIAHGGGKRCQVDGCSKSAVGGMLCVSHGGGKRCQSHGCNKGAVRNGVCIRHGAKRESHAASSSASRSPSPERYHVKDEFSP